MRGQKSLIVFSSEYIKSAIGFVGLFIVTRFMGSEVLGTVGYYLSVLGLFSIFLDLGLSSAHIKRVSEKADLGTCNGSFLLLKLIAFFVYSILVIGYIMKVGFDHEAAASTTTTTLIPLILFIYYLFEQSTTALTITFSAREEFAKMNVPTILGGTMKTLVVVVAAFLRWGAVGLAVAYLADAGFSFLFGAIFFIRSRIPVSRPTWQMVKSYFRYALPMTIIIPMSVFISNIDRIMIKTLSSTQEVGFYFAVQSIVDVCKQFSSSAMTVLLPKISSDYARNRVEEIAVSVHKAGRYLSIMVMPLAVLLSTQSDWIVRICFGSKFAPAASVLSTLALGAIVLTIVRPYSNVLFGIERHQKIAWMSFINLLVLVGCNLFFIPEGKTWFGFSGLGLGAGGAALSNLVISIVSSCFQIYLVYRYLKFRFDLRIFKHLGCGLLMGGAIYFSKFAFGGLDWPIAVKLMFCSLIGVGTYLSALTLVGEWRKTDWDYLRLQMDPKRLTYDAIKEMKEKGSVQ